MTHTEAPPAPEAVEDELPPAEPEVEPDDVDVDEPAPAPAQRSPRAPRRRGVPVEPLVIAAGNGATMTATAAYQAAGAAGLVVAAGALGAGTLVAVARRRSTVKARRAVTAAGRPRGGGAAPGRGRGRGGALGTPSGRGRGRAAGSGAAAPKRGAGTPRGGAGLGAGRKGAPRTGLRSALGAVGTRRGRAGLLSSGAPSGRAPKHARGRGAGKSSTRTPRTRRGLMRSALGATARGLGATGRRIGATGRALGRGAVRPAAAAARLARRVAKRTEGARQRIARNALKSARAAWDGLLTGTAGVASALWHKSARAGLATIRAVWAKRRRRRAEKAAAAGPAMTGPDVASARPPVAPYVRRPAFTGGTPSHTGAAMSGGHHFLAPAMELERVATTYKPDGMMQVGRDFAALPQALEHIANSLKISTARADAEQPLDPRIVEIMQQIYLMQMKAAELSRELGPAFRKLHAVDIERLQQPRKGRHAEAEWDVRANADVTL